MKRVVVTGMGIVSCLGNETSAVTESLREGKSGIRFVEAYKEIGLRSQIAGTLQIDPASHIDRKTLRFMGDAASYAYISMDQAIKDAGLRPEQISNPRTGLIMGSGGASSMNVVRGADILREKGIRRVGAYMVPRCMSSTTSACLATPFKIKGVNYTISSACATSAHCIGSGMEQIQLGKQDIIFAGGGEEEHWSLTMMFDGMGALSTKYNDTPEKASRPYDTDRDGFVIAGGGGTLVLEEFEHARKRGARIIAELVGYGATSDGYNMVAPSGEGAVRCMHQALETVNTPIDYINTHGTSTPVGDLVELQAMKEVFGDTVPPFSSTKSLAGHSLGATSVHEAIYSLLMLEHDFIAASANVENRDESLGELPLVTERMDNANLTTVMSNSFGFGGTNSTLVFRRYEEIA
jgi:3-oxoacyl-[acyl-carrier-protein] synthase-1